MRRLNGHAAVPVTLEDAMANLWVRASPGRPEPIELGSGVLTLLPGDPWVEPLAGPRGSAPAETSIRLHRTTRPPGVAWVLVAGPAAAVRVNGEPLPTGIRVLASRDEIRVGQTTTVFADERHARVEPLPPTDRSVPCARCTSVIAPASPSVRCPSCGSWFHEHGELPCWTAVPFCQSCGGSTSIDDEACWVPEET